MIAVITPDLIILLKELVPKTKFNINKEIPTEITIDPEVDKLKIDFIITKQKEDSRPKINNQRQPLFLFLTLVISTSLNCNHGYH